MSDAFWFAVNVQLAKIAIDAVFVGILTASLFAAVLFQLGLKVVGIQKIFSSTGLVVLTATFFSMGAIALYLSIHAEELQAQKIEQAWTE